MIKDKVTFEEIFEQNERRINCHTRVSHISDLHQECYQNGLFAMWNAYKIYQPDTSPLATYFNYIIRNRMNDLMNEKMNEQENKIHLQEVGITYGSGAASNQMKVAEEPLTY